MASFSCEGLIDAVQNEPSLWNTELNSNEEEKELAWTHDLCFLFFCTAPKFNAVIAAEATDAPKINVEQTIIKSSSAILHKCRSDHVNRSNT